MGGCFGKWCAHVHKWGVGWGRLVNLQLLRSDFVTSNTAHNPWSLSISGCGYAETLQILRL